MSQTVIYILIVSVISLGLTMWALTDSLQKDFGSGKAKFLWHIIALVPFIGWLIYFLFGARHGKKIT